MHNPESLEKVPINTFKDVLTHICKKQTADDDSFRVRHLKFKFTKEKFLEIGATVERKGKNEAKWYTDVQDEKARVKREAEEEEERKRKEEEEKKARQPGNEDTKAPEKKPEKKKEEERTPEEIEDEQAHLFYIDFVHEDIARQRRIEEIASRKAAKDKTKGDDKGKAKGAPAKDAGKDGKKDGKKDDKKGKGGEVEEKKENVIHTMDIDLKKIQKLRIDHKFGQVYKILFHYNDESVNVIEIPPLGEEQGKAFMALVDAERQKKEAQEKKRLDDYNREHRKHERAEKRKRIQARKNGEVYQPTEFTKEKPQPKVESDEEKRIIDQSIYYVNNYKEIDGLWAIFHPELKNFKFWGAIFKVKKTEAELEKVYFGLSKEKEEAEKKKTEEAEKLANPKAVEENKKEAEEAKKLAEKNDPYKLKDDFIRNYSLSRLGLKLIFFIDYHVTPEKKEKHTVTVSSQKFKDDLFKENYDAVTKFIHEILPDSSVLANFRKLGAIGLFRVYTYGFGENPEQEKEFFSNKHIKTAFPDIKKLYYDLIDEFVHYDDLKKLEVRQREELISKQRVTLDQGIPVPNDKKTQATLPAS